MDYCSELLYIALSDLSIESGYESLVMNGADAPSGRQARRHWRRSEFQDWCELKEECLDERRGMLREKVCAAADYHDRPYHGDKNDEMVRGIEAKEGTNWGHVFLCLDIVASGRAVTLDFESKGKLKQTPKLLGKLLEEGRKKVEMDLILLDREFYDVKSLNVVSDFDMEFIVPAKNTSKVKKVKEKFEREIPCKVDYTMRSSEGEEKDVKLCLVEKKEGGGIQGFVTNMDWGPEAVAEFYRSRWEVETNHSSRNEFRPLTTSKRYARRFLYFLLSVILRNIWSLATNIHLERDKNPLKKCLMKDSLRDLYKKRFGKWAGKPAGPGPPIQITDH